MATSPSIRDHGPITDADRAPAPPPGPKKRSYELDTRVLTVFFFVAMPFVAFGSFIVVSMARGLLQDSLGVSLEQRAVETKLHLERYVGEQIAHLNLLSLDPQVRTAVTATAAKPVDLQKMEAAWAAGGDSTLTGPILDSPLARRLRDYIQIRPAVRLVQVVDGSGRIVASSTRGGRFDHKDEAWFRSFSREPFDPRAYVGDIHRPAGRTVALLEVAYPIHDTQTGEWLGGVRALVDASDVYSVIAPVRVGRTGHGVLIRGNDGLVLASDEGSRVLKETYQGFGAIRAAMAERRGYWIVPPSKAKTQEGAPATEAEPGRLVGYAPVDQVPNVNWVVAVEQDLSEATAPIEGVTRYLWWHFIGAFGTIILLALYFSFKLEAPVIDDELHLHEEHVPAGYQKVAS